MAAVATGRPGPVNAALLEFHGVRAIRGGSAPRVGRARGLERAVVDAVAAASRPDQARACRSTQSDPSPWRRCIVSGPATSRRPTAAAAVLADLLVYGRLRRDADSVPPPGRPAAAGTRGAAAPWRLLVGSLDMAAPSSLAAAALSAGCPPDAVRELERDGRIVLVGDDLAWARPAWERLRDLALGLARTGPLTPAALRDASGTSRKYVMALLEDLQRRGILTRTAAGHVPGPPLAGGLCGPRPDACQRRTPDISRWRSM